MATKKKAPAKKPVLHTITANRPTSTRITDHSKVGAKKPHATTEKVNQYGLSSRDLMMAALKQHTAVSANGKSIAKPVAAKPVASKPVSSKPVTATPKPGTPAKPGVPAGPIVPSDTDWLNQDQGYLLTRAGLAKSLANSQADINHQRQDYDTQYQSDLRSLGYQGGHWNQNDMNTQSGAAFQNQQNDFAARGMLRSSGFANNMTNLTRTLNDQLGNAEQARTTFRNTLSAQSGALQDENNDRLTQAKIAALDRKKQKYVSQAGAVVS